MIKEYALIKFKKRVSTMGHDASNLAWTGINVE